MPTIGAGDKDIKAMTTDSASGRIRLTQSVLILFSYVTQNQSCGSFKQHHLFCTAELNAFSLFPNDLLDIGSTLKSNYAHLIVTVLKIICT